MRYRPSMARPLTILLVLGAVGFGAVGCEDDTTPPSSSPTTTFDAG